MAGVRETPRQKMINLMYLVFIAMIALNVDREVLRSFEDVNQSLELSANLTNESNQIFYQTIKNSKEGREDYDQIIEKAEELKSITSSAIDAIYLLKDKIKKETKYKPPENGKESDYGSLQNLDASNRILFKNESNPTDDAKRMADAMKKLKTYFLTIAKNDKHLEKRINKIFEFNGKQGNDYYWLNKYFYDQPMIASLTNLSKLELNVRTEEGNIVRNMMDSKLKDDIELKAFKPIVAAPKFVRVGENFNVDIAFGAYDNSLVGKIVLDGGGEVPLENGQGRLSLTGNGVGVKYIRGKMYYKGPDGKDVIEDFNESYEVVSDVTKDVSSVATISADKMNVVYRGVVNPISVSVTGVDASTIGLSASSGSLSKSATGKWNYKPGGGTEVTFTATGKTSQGKVISNSVKYRIKNVPPPQGQIRGETVLSMPASSIANQRVTAVLPYFEFDVNFTVTEFKVKVPGKATAFVSGSSLSGASGVLSGLRKGDQVLIFDISATAAGIPSRNISPVVINVN